jgi:hypothetical protein
MFGVLTACTRMMAALPPPYSSMKTCRLITAMAFCQSKQVGRFGIAGSYSIGDTQRFAKLRTGTSRTDFHGSCDGSCAAAISRLDKLYIHSSRTAPRGTCFLQLNATPTTIGARRERVDQCSESRSSVFAPSRLRAAHPSGYDNGHWHDYRRNA